MNYFYKTISSPFGKLKLVASERGLAAILWEKDDPRRVRLGLMKPDSDNRFLKETERQLKAYFDGKLKKFTVRLDFKGTDFQKSVWAALLSIPFGETRSYGEIARQIGRPQASRAVGAANGRNPISIIALLPSPPVPRSAQRQADRFRRRPGSQGSVAEARGSRSPARPCRARISQGAKPVEMDHAVRSKAPVPDFGLGNTGSKSELAATGAS